MRETAAGRAYNNWYFEFTGLELDDVDMFDDRGHADLIANLPNAPEEGLHPPMTWDQNVGTSA